MLGIDDAITAVTTLADSAIKRIWPDATEIEKAKLAELSQEMQNQFNLVMGQLDINKIEAGSSSVFVSGWRPAIGWICGAALAYSALIEPFARFVAVVAFGYAGIFPVIDTNITLQILMGLLGLSGMRSFEKTKGVAR
ncbi:holin (3TMs family) [Methylobacter tundripaludum]|uniref:Holin (3TMs family) n=1 Tax=Methylobacter tundripaludum TaxID=173365 RepID=A0A2S6H5H0_9GAMM|nr:3TM-type holin [Methylobacter tundripaludum]PPK72671.1 holin (3TMs family) [Methylobacter tundripaludum]